MGDPAAVEDAIVIERAPGDREPTATGAAPRSAILALGSDAHATTIRDMLTVAGYRAVGSAGDADATLRLAERLAPDVAVIAADLPGLSDAIWPNLVALGVASILLVDPPVAGGT